jgi:hypothetical protein
MPGPAPFRSRAFFGFDHRFGKTEYQTGRPRIFFRDGKLFERKQVLAGPDKNPGAAEEVIMAPFFR